MVDVLLEPLAQLFSLFTGHAVVYIVTLGRVRCGDTVASIIGLIFWMLVFVAIFMNWK